MIKISKLKVFTHKNHSLKLFRHFNEFKNKPQITKTIKEIKEFTSDNLKELKSLLYPEKKIHIFKIFSLTKFMFVGTRLQVLAYSIGTLSYSVYALYSKYYKLYYHRKSERARIMRIKIISAFILVVISSGLGLFITKMMGRRIIKSIYYLPAEESFEINYFNWFCFNKALIVPLQNVKKLDKKRRFDSTIEYENINHQKYKLLSTRGTGLWINKNLIPALINDIKVK